MSEATRNQILQQAIVNLLALAEVASALTPEQREQLKARARELEENLTEEWLALVNLEVRRLLGDVPGFLEAVRAWEAGIPLRVGIDTGELEKSLPGSQGRTPIDIVIANTIAGLLDPWGLAQDEPRRQHLEDALRPSPSQPEAGQPAQCADAQSAA